MKASCARKAQGPVPSGTGLGATFIPSQPRELQQLAHGGQDHADDQQDEGHDADDAGQYQRDLPNTSITRSITPSCVGAGRGAGGRLPVPLPTSSLHLPRADYEARDTGTTGSTPMEMSQPGSVSLMLMGVPSQR